MMHQFSYEHNRSKIRTLHPKIINLEPHSQEKRHVNMDPSLHCIYTV